VVRPRNLEERSFRFACTVAELCGQLVGRGPTVRELSRQLLRSGTSVGANLEEAVAAQSRADFISKCSLALKEAREVRYWLKLVAAAAQGTAAPIGPAVAEAGQLVAILAAIVRTAKANALRV
jgi:four helix bundle protein